jgi:hypothetical protein
MGFSAPPREDVDRCQAALALVVAVADGKSVRDAVIDKKACWVENGQEAGTFCHLEAGHAGRHLSQISPGVYVMWP